MTKSKILIQDFIAVCYKICDDASWRVDDYLIRRHPNSRSKHIKLDDVLLIADMLIAEANVSDIDIKSFKDGVNKLFTYEEPVKYERGIMYATCQFIGKY